jgi:hypothetical protein
MALADDNQERIEAYLQGRLSPEEVTALETAMQEDPDLQEQIALAKIEYVAIEYHVEQQLRANIEDWLETKPPQKTPPSKLKWWLSSFALLGSLALIGWFFSRPQPAHSSFPVPEPALLSDSVRTDSLVPDTTIQQPLPNTPPDIPIADSQPTTAPVNPKEERAQLAYAEVVRAEVQSLISSEQPISTTRSGAGNADNSLLDRAINDFKASEYKAAITKLQQIDQSDPAYPAARDLLAYSYLYDKNYARAAPLFQRIINAKAGRYKTEPAQWALTLCHLARYDQHQDDFEQSLNTILDNERHDYHDEAKALQQMLRQ